MEEAQKVEAEKRKKLDDELKKKAEEFENMKNSLLIEKREKEKREKDLAVSINS